MIKRIPALTLTVEADELVSFCNKLLKCSRDVNKTHEALITLESFLVLFASDRHGTESCSLIESTIKSIIETSQQRVLEKASTDLLQALQQCNVISLASVHTSLSRNGFYQILQAVIPKLTDDDIRLVMVWTANWIKEARELAEQASRFPDAMDFKKAGININQFYAIEDLDRVLNVTD